MKMYVEEMVLLLFYLWLCARSGWCGNLWKSVYWLGAFLVTLAAMKGLSK